MLFKVFFIAEKNKLFCSLISYILLKNIYAVLSSFQMSVGLRVHLIFL